MAELQNPDPLVEAVAKARKEISARPDTFATGRLVSLGNSRINGRQFWGAWSGPVTVNNNRVTSLDFVSPNYVTTMTVCFGWNAAGGTLSGDYLGYEIDFDGAEIMKVISRHTAGQTNPDFDVLHIIIPAQTRVQFQSYTTDANNINTFTTIYLEEI